MVTRFVTRRRLARRACDAACLRHARRNRFIAASLAEADGILGRR